MIITGLGTTIIQQLRRLTDEQMIRPDIKLTSFGGFDLDPEDIKKTKRYVFAQGMLMPRRITDQSPCEIRESLAVNLVSVINLCELVLDTNPRARICVIGSMSAIRGSYDTTYALAKASLHRYVETRKLTSPEQQLVGVAPSIIWDSGMTQSRDDLDDLMRKMQDLPKRRYVSAIEVARLIHFLLYLDSGYITNTVIEMKGGVH